MQNLIEDIKRYKQTEDAPTFSGVFAAMSFAAGVILTALSSGLCALVMFGIGAISFLASKVQNRNRIDSIVKTMNAHEDISQTLVSYRFGGLSIDTAKKSYTDFYKLHQPKQGGRKQPSDTDSLIAANRASLKPGVAQ